MKKLLAKIRNSWFGPLMSSIGRLNSHEVPICDRNDTEYENKRRLEDTIYLERFGYKVYSQNDEDGIIAEIFNRIGTTNKTFVEFGVQTGLESNCHFLLHKGWNGLWIDGDENYFTQLTQYFEKPIRQKQLIAINAFIDKNNINELIGERGNINGGIDLLSIDIDGNDYWVWESINCIKPRVVVIEYNAKFPPPYEWVMPYNQNHVWDGSDLHGASLKALEVLGKRLGFQLVGTNMNGVNAFFVKEELTKDLFAKPATAENLYHSWHGRRFESSGHQTKTYIGN
jgi:hypothetical protein